MREIKSYFPVVLELTLMKVNDIRCALGRHLYPKRWSSREKHVGVFDGEVYYQFKTCPNCGAEKMREV